LQRFVEKFSEELQEDFIELVHNSSMKGNLKFFPFDVLWVVFSKNSTVNNGTNGKVSKNGTCFQYWGGGLEFERRVWILGLHLGFWSFGVGVWGSRIGGLMWRVWGLSLEKFNISVPNNCGFQQANSTHT